MFGVLVAYNTVVACIIECVVSLADRKRERKRHGATLKEKVVQVVRESLSERVDERYLRQCVEREIRDIQGGDEDV